MENLKKNVIYQTAYQVLITLLPIVTAPYIARILGADGLGIYSYTYSIVTYFVLVARLGIQVYGNRAIAIVRDDQTKLNQTFSDLLFIHVVVSLIVILIYFGYILLARANYKNIFIIQSLYIIGELLEVNWLFFGLEKFRLTVTRNSVIKLLTVIAVFSLVREKEDVWKYCLIMAAGMALSDIVVWIFVPKYVSLVKPNIKNAVRHLKPLISFFIPAIAVSLYKVMDKIMLGAMTNTAQVGFYENSEKIINMMLGFVTAIGTVMMPRMSNLIARGDKKEGQKLVDNSMKIISVASLGICFGIIGVSTVFAPVFFGEEFRSCNVLMSGLAVSIPFTAFANVLRTQYLIPNHKDTAYQTSVITGAAVNLVVNYLLIRTLLAGGAVIGTIVAEATVCIIQAIYSRNALPIKRYIKSSIPYIAIGLLMSILVYYIGEVLGSGVITLVLQVSAGVIVYGGLTLVYMYIKKDELLYALIGKVVRKR